MSFNPCIIIPSYNHGGAIESTIRGLSPLGLACLVVDDGSNDGTRDILARLAAELEWIGVISRTENGGKGAALMDGFREALRRGFTHVLLVDADGQHDPSSARELLSRAEGSPFAVVLGSPVFERTAPRVRVYGREVTNAFVWFLTLSFSIRDALCGLRVYPLERFAPAIFATRTRRMEFDVEALVRLAWAGATFVNVPAPVSYPADGVSHFSYVRDNAMIAALITRLLAALPFRLPGILIRRSRARGARRPEDDVTPAARTSR